MKTLDQEITDRKHQKFKTLNRIKIGRVLMVYASLPLMSAWAYLIAVPMCLTLSPSVWAKSKIIGFKEWRSLQ